MRCGLCGDQAGWWRRRCRDCATLWNAWQANRAAGMRRVLAALGDTGIAVDKIERFLGGEPSRGRGSVRDLIVADASNQLLDALGRPHGQSGVEVKRLRERGAWRLYDRRPED